STVTSTAGASLGGAHSISRNSPPCMACGTREAQVPHPLARDLPEFLPTLGRGTPPIWVFFDIFISEDRLECSPSMIKIQDILDQESIGVQGGDEQLVDPLIHTLAHLHGLAGGRSGMSGHNHSGLRQALT